MFWLFSCYMLHYVFVSLSVCCLVLSRQRRAGFKSCFLGNLIKTKCFRIFCQVFICLSVAYKTKSQRFKYEVEKKMKTEYKDGLGLSTYVVM